MADVNIHQVVSNVELPDGGTSGAGSLSREEIERIARVAAAMVMEMLRQNQASRQASQIPERMARTTPF
jgi:hypothetical protein